MRLNTDEPEYKGTRSASTGTAETMTEAVTVALRAHRQTPPFPQGACDSCRIVGDWYALFRKLQGQASKSRYPALRRKRLTKVIVDTSAVLAYTSSLMPSAAPVLSAMRPFAECQWPHSPRSLWSWNPKRAIAAAAWSDFGKGRSPAKLNLGEPLLFKGADLSRTDVSSAI
jgi:hypothetical protein